MPPPTPCGATIWTASGSDGRLAAVRGPEMRLPARMSVPRIIADRAEGAPESIVLVRGSETSTYREFDLLANQIASYL